LNTISKNFGLIVNKKKSGIIPIKFEISDDLEEINGFPVLKEYCYLGMVLNGKGSVDG
jgi:hypothetical protein